MSLPSWQLRFVADASTAILWHIEDRMTRLGEPFDVAKGEALKRAAPTWKHLDSGTQQAMRIMVASLSPADLSRSTLKELDRRWRKSVEDYAIKTKGRLRWYDRLSLRLFGVVW